MCKGFYVCEVCKHLFAQMCIQENKRYKMSILHSNIMILIYICINPREYITLSTKSNLQDEEKRGNMKMKKGMWVRWVNYENLKRVSP